jgi:hypothetical protein
MKTIADATIPVAFIWVHTPVLESYTTSRIV